MVQIHMRYGKVSFSNILFKHSTKAEDVVFDILVGMGVRFRTQMVMGPFIVDFFVKNPRLIIEIDGGYHNNHHQKECDRKREVWLKHNFHTKVIRFTNEEVFTKGFEDEFTGRILRLLSPSDSRAKQRFKIK
jgi:very-short-patch-repair endonuclease